MKYALSSEFPVNNKLYHCDVFLLAKKPLFLASNHSAIEVHNPFFSTLKILYLHYALCFLFYLVRVPPPQLACVFASNAKRHHCRIFRDPVGPHLVKGKNSNAQAPPPQFFLSEKGTPRSVEVGHVPTLEERCVVCPDSLKKDL